MYKRTLIVAVFLSVVGVLILDLPGNSRSLLPYSRAEGPKLPDLDGTLPSDVIPQQPRSCMGHKQFRQMPGFNGFVREFAVYNDGSGSTLYAGGSFTETAANPPEAVKRIAKWNGETWLPLGSGMTASVTSLAVFKRHLYAGGFFYEAGGVTVNKVARWDGSAWSDVDGGIVGDYRSVHALTVFNNGDGGALYVAGNFDQVGTSRLAARNIAKWDGQSWSALDLGVHDGGGSLPYLSAHAMAVFDDGTGPALYVGGEFTHVGSSSLPASSIAKWNGSSWSALGDGIAGTVIAMTTFDDGNGPALYVGGDFETAGGVTVNNIAKWNGTQWSAVGSEAGTDGPIPWILELTVFDDGDGSSLYAGGAFTGVNGGTANYVAKWDGQSWWTLGSGTAGGPPPHVRAMIGFSTGQWPALILGGDFTRAGAVEVDRVAKWGFCCDEVPAAPTLPLERP